MTDKVWLNKKEVCFRLGNISYDTLNILIKSEDFPEPVAFYDHGNKKWYIPLIEEWECKKVSKPTKHQKGFDLMQGVQTPDVAIRESTR